jgi:hypothetical protein
VRAVLRLEQRAGLGSEGLAVTPLVRPVPAPEAQVLLSSFDCGARGRWVFLESVRATRLCASSAGEPDPAACTWVTSLEVGGSSVDGTGWTLLVRESEAVVARLRIVSVTPTPTDWYLTDAPFEVAVEVAR